MRVMAGVATLGDLQVRSGREPGRRHCRGIEGWLRGCIRLANRRVPSADLLLVYRILCDPSDAADTTQDVFLKVFRGIEHFMASPA